MKEQKMKEVYTAEEYQCDFCYEKPYYTPLEIKDNTHICTPCAEKLFIKIKTYIGD